MAREVCKPLSKLSTNHPRRLVSLPIQQREKCSAQQCPQLIILWRLENGSHLCSLNTVLANTSRHSYHSNPLVYILRSSYRERPLIPSASTSGWGDATTAWDGVRYRMRDIRGGQGRGMEEGEGTRPMLFFQSFAPCSMWLVLRCVPGSLSRRCVVTLLLYKEGIGLIGKLL